MPDAMALTLRGAVARTAVVHTLSYFAVGLLAFTVFDYSQRFADPVLRDYMRQTSDPLVMAGVLFQPIRGALFGTVFYLLRDVLFRRGGWWITWVTLVVIGIVSPFGPAPGSIEGVIYTKLPIGAIWGGLIEVVVQSFVLSTLLFHWVIHPEKRWLSWLLTGLFIVALGLPILGLLSQPVGAG
jgi:uncharacterized membrane protein